MNIANQPFGLPDTAPELARRFAVIMAGLGALVARRFLKMPHLVGFTQLLWGRLNRSVRRFYRALTQAPGKVRARGERTDVVRVRPVGLPSRRGWIVRELGWEAAAYMAQLEALLREIATQATIARSPAAARVLRPICRMLGVSPEVTPVIMPTKQAPKAEVTEQRLEPVGLPGVVGDCGAFATRAG